MITKIHGQPTDQDVTLLKKDIIIIMAMNPTILGGGGHRHARLILKPAKHLLMMHRTAFVAPANPGNFPAGIATMQLPEHKQGKKQCTRD
jgi:hypothetical protein